FARRHLEEDYSESPDIAALVRWFLAQKLRRHIRERSRHHLLTTPTIDWFRRIACERLSEAKVQHLDAVRLRDHHVCAPQVAMNDPVFVCVRQRLGQLNAIADDRGQWQGADAYQRAQGASPHMLHHDENVL